MDFFLRVFLENQGSTVNIVYFDFSKLSDGVSHDMFLDKDELMFKYRCAKHLIR